MAHPVLPPAVTGTRSLDGGPTPAEIVTSAPQPPTFAEVTEISRLPKSTAFRLLGALLCGGLVDRDGDGRYHSGWLLHGLRGHTPSQLRRQLAADEAFLGFLSERLTEEIICATHRRETAANSSSGTNAGLQLMDDLVLSLQRGALPDDTTLQLLVRAYAAHPDFRAEWRSPQEYAEHHRALVAEP